VTISLNLQDSDNPSPLYFPFLRQQYSTEKRYKTIFLPASSLLKHRLQMQAGVEVSSYAVRHLLFQGKMNY